MIGSGQRDPIPEFILLTGALGSGKTTLLSDYLALPAATGTAVIVNEVGEINIDGAVLSADRRQLPIALLSNGCVCCSMGGDLHAAIDEILRTYETRSQSLRRIVLETSGLAAPGPIIRLLAGYAQEDFRVRITTTFDATSHRSTKILASSAAQLAAAQCIAVSKLDLAGAQNEHAIRSSVRALNPFATIVMTMDKTQRAEFALGAFASNELTKYSASFDEIVTMMHADVSVLAAQWNVALSWDELQAWIENVSSFAGERLLRVKGLIDVLGSERPILIESVGGTFSQPRTLEVGRTPERGIVIITQHLGLEELLQFNASLPPPLPTLRLSSRTSRGGKIESHVCGGEGKRDGPST